MTQVRIAGQVYHNCSGHPQWHGWWWTSWLNTYSKPDGPYPTAEIAKAAQRWYIDTIVDEKVEVTWIHPRERKLVIAALNLMDAISENMEVDVYYADLKCFLEKRYATSYRPKASKEAQHFPEPKPRRNG